MAVTLAASVSVDATGRPFGQLLSMLMTGEQSVGVLVDECTPSQVHLSLTGDLSEMTVMWVTSSKGCPAEVTYYKSTEGNGKQQLAHGTWDTYHPGDMCGVPARMENFSPPNIHRAVLTGLDPATEYIYSINGVYSNQFWSARNKGAEETFSFVAYADMGEPWDKAAKSPLGGMVEESVAKDLKEHRSEMIFHMGDIAYAEGKSHIWDRFFELIEPYASTMPYMIGAGNHEYDYTDGKSRDPSGWKPYLPDWGNFDNGSGGECGVPTAKRFAMPSQWVVDPQAIENLTTQLAPLPPFWYEYSYGRAHFIVLSSEHRMDEDSEQYIWLEAALERVDRCVTPWLIVGFHRPMYVSHPHGGNHRVGKHLAKEFEHLLYENNVDIVINGHVHSYLRTCEVYSKECIGRDKGGVIHLVIGTGGHELSHVEKKQAHWAETALKVPGFGRFTIHGSDSLEFHFINSESGEDMDHFKISSRTSLCNSRQSAPLDFPGIGVNTEEDVQMDA